MTQTDVIVVGAGPTGLMLACELAQAGVRCRLLERRAEQPNITRAFAVHARTLELLDARGLADDLLARGVPVRQVAPAPGATLDLRKLRTRYPMVLIVPQSGTEHLLEARARELGVEIVRGAEVVGLRQDDRRVVVELAGGRTETASYAVGCDGAHSTVRGLAGIDFAGKQYQTHILLADVRVTEPPQDALFAEASDEGVVLMVPFGDGWFRAIAWDRLREQVPLDVPLPMEEMRDAFVRIAGTDFGMREQRWSSRFLSERRQAARYRAGRVFLAGDSAHVHSPLGAQGMNTGIGDAMNLGWKLAAVLRGRAPGGLLDSYERERHRVGAQVLTLTDAFNRLVLGRSAIRRALRNVTLRLALRYGRSRSFLAGRLTGLGIHYPPATRRAHPWTGRRMPDLRCAEGRLYELLRDGRPLLVDATPSGEVARAVGDTVKVARHEDPGVPGAVLVRPDGYVAWAADRGDLPGEAMAAVAQWCGAPAHAHPARP
ncbi:2-polyprenyl-6-methoxyphenol hydroxylase-like FAD-dependent oxidoreductase [Nonomuraea thailandensis]|uniref:2-polyprenyl-6-methoxyphenol hydroxylase-like FAD-dependent oxidoreductase n=1 Tax=Nonomuraea thailandensis TaxID=1188745 RepID=A0A9X2K469_9ACTN|nr:FAD-dependent monooxygenase [Nonomuraea thailandensis]MCP2360202.1 2-polyprenyl-6-methoxyphenol hydroxylase-like FAD-dependent oxidoreductase [Nonomuraea thailandensis]